MTDRELDLQHDKVSAEIANLNALTAKAITDMKKTSLETKWYLPVIVSGGTFALIASTAALVKAFL